MKDRQRIVSLFFEKGSFKPGHIDVTEKLYEIIPKEDIEAIKYMMPSATEAGIYFTIVLMEKKESKPSILGFAG